MEHNTGYTANYDEWRKNTMSNISQYGHGAVNLNAYAKNKGSFATAPAIIKDEQPMVIADRKVFFFIRSIRTHK